LANHKSAIKRARQNEGRRIRNKASKTRIKNVVKNVRLAASQGSSEEALTRLNTAISTIDKAARKKVIHKNNAARKKSQITKLINEITA
jgi:small subunit ribosomal protein S20